MNLTMRHIKNILILPFNVVITVPIIILTLTKGFILGSIYLAIIGFIVMAIGGFLFVWTIRLFSLVGQGTLAPWDPTQHLVVQGPYQYVRNPMISGVLFVLLGEAMLFSSGWIFGFFILFMTLNTVYFKISEEPGLIKRFGHEYEEYCKQVPMWIPRLSPWEKE